MVTLKTTLNQLQGLWVFQILDNNGQLLYIGCERLKTIPTLRECKRQAGRQLPQDITLELITPVATAEEGNEVIETLKWVVPPKYGRRTLDRGRAVVCVQTGERYPNAHQAANANNINYSYMHYHLQGLSSYKHCKGLTFKYDDNN
jgi:hypothetical protein